MVGLFSATELASGWRKILLDDKVRSNAPLLEVPFEDFGETPAAALTEFLRRLRELVSPSELPRLNRQCVIITNGYTATLKTEVAAYLSNCLGVPVLATHRYGRCTRDGLLDRPLRDTRYMELFNDARNVVQRGYSVILDGTFTDVTWRDEAYALAEQAGGRLIVLKHRCEDESYIRARLWRRRLDHSRSEHEVTRFENFQLTHRAIHDHPIEADAGYGRVSAEAVMFENHGDRRVSVDPTASDDAHTIADLIRISPFMSLDI